MAKLVRRIAHKGEFHDVEYAVEADGNLPGWEFMCALRGGTWEPDPDAENIPCDEQIVDAAKFLEMVRVLATEGLPTYQTGVNFLDDGIWEFKVGKKRLSFYDTLGDGTYTAKNRVPDTASAEDDDEFWWFPRFDRTIRLGYAFPKMGPKTEIFDLAAAARVREEDLQHDE